MNCLQQERPLLNRDTMLEEKREPSVWYIAGVATCVFVGIMIVGGLFTGSEVVAVAAQ